MTIPFSIAVLEITIMTQKTLNDVMSNYHTLLYSESKEVQQILPKPTYKRNKGKNKTNMVCAHTNGRNDQV